MFKPIHTLLICVATTLQAPGTEEPNPAAKQRKTLPVEYHIVATVSRQETTTSGLSTTIEFALETWHKADQSRTDVRVTSDSTAVDRVGTREIVCRSCERKAYFLITSQGLKDAVAQVEFHKPGPLMDVIDQYRLDWRYLGLLDGDLFAYKRESPENTLSWFRLTSRGTSERVTINDVEYTVTRVNLDNGDQFEAHFRPDQGMNPVQYISRMALLNGEQQTSIRYTQANGFWYPEQIEHTRTANGKQVVREITTLLLRISNRKYPIKCSHYRVSV